MEATKARAGISFHARMPTGCAGVYRRPREAIASDADDEELHITYEWTDINGTTGNTEDLLLDAATTPANQC